MSTIGQRINELRKSNSFSQEYVAEKLNVSRQAVSKWEQDLSAPDTYNLIALAELFGVSVEFLATGKLRDPIEPTLNPPPPPPRSGITVRQILGLILVALGLLAAILGFVLEDAELLLIMALYVTVTGILCIAVKKHFGLTLAWVLICITFPFVFMLMPVTPSTGVGSGASSVSISIGGIFIIAVLGLLILTAILSVIKIISSRRNK